MWRPDSPSHPFWRELQDEIENSSPLEGGLHFRFWCQEDFWFFMRNCMSLGQLCCGDIHNQHYGKRWLDHPWLFDRCRDFEADPDDRLFKWPRGYFKTSIITQGGILWEHIKNPSLRTLILTYKLVPTGESFIRGIALECEQNARLKFHWPEIFWSDPKKDALVWTKTALDLKRTEVMTMREPSIQVAPLDQAPTGGHFGLIQYDDCVTRETVTNPGQAKKTFSALQQSTFLGNETTKRRYVGTYWSLDDPWQRAARQEIFTVDHQDCYQDGKPVLMSKEYLEKLERNSGRYDFNTQMRGVPISSGQRIFLNDWLQDYENEPTDEAKGKNLYMFADVAKGGGPDADYSCIAVVGLGDDNNYYLIDLRRDRWNMVEFCDMVIEMAKFWRPLTCYVEEFGGMRPVEEIKNALHIRKWRGIDVRSLPHEKGDAHKFDKAARIMRLQNSFGTFRWWLPKAVGYRSKDDPRDCLQAFLDDEYRRWTPGIEIEHDDMLDTLAMVLNTELKLHWPQGARQAGYSKRRNAPSYTKREASAWAN